MKTIIKLSIIVLALNIGQVMAQKSSDVKTVMYECNFDCHSCEDKVMKNIAYEKGVKDVKVFYGENQVKVSYKTSKNDEEAIEQALVDLGFKATNLGTATSFVVKGNCDMCKDKIETATNAVNGVNTAHWNQENKELTLAYNEDETSLEIIHKAIAAIGYDTDEVRAEDEVYNNLHNCCKYDR